MWAARSSSSLVATTSTTVSSMSSSSTRLLHTMLVSAAASTPSNTSSSDVPNPSATAALMKHHPALAPNVTLPTLTANVRATDLHSKHKKIVQMYTLEPEIAPSAFIAESALVFGEVEIHYKTSVWGNTVICGDANSVKLGFQSSLGEGCSVLTTSKHETDIGYYVTAGPGCTFKGCIVQGRTIVGEGSTILEGAVVEANTILEPGSVVPPGYTLEGGKVWGGSPVQPVRHLTEDDKDRIEQNAVQMHHLAWEHTLESSPFSTDVFRELETLSAEAARQCAAQGLQLVDEYPGVYAEDAVIDRK